MNELLEQGIFVKDKTINHPSFSGSDAKIWAISRPYLHHSPYGSQIIPATRLFEIATLSYSVFRDKKPVRSLGTIYAKQYTRGPRTIAGSMVFAISNEHPLASLINQNVHLNAEDKDHGLARQKETYTLSDQIPPFDIHIFLSNETGYASKICLYGIDLHSEGLTLSVHDMYTELVSEYTATEMETLHTNLEFSKVSVLTKSKDLDFWAEKNSKDGVTFRDIVSRKESQTQKILNTTRNPYK